MSGDGHEHHDESGLNRTWLSGTFLLLALGAAAWAGSLGSAPGVGDAARGPQGVVVLDDAKGTRIEGVVLLRGGTLAVVSEDGREQSCAVTRFCPQQPTQTIGLVDTSGLGRSAPSHPGQYA